MARPIKKGGKGEGQKEGDDPLEGTDHLLSSVKEGIEEAEETRSEDEGRKADDDEEARIGLRSGQIEGQEQGEGGHHEDR